MPLLSIHTSLNDPRIVLCSMRGREALSELFSFELEIDSHELSLRQDSFLFKNISIQIQTHSTQLFNGIVA